jgi:hypothetical protein
MLQIKTIRAVYTDDFDFQVNGALQDGWTLVRRLSGHDFIAELEKEVITEEERSCENCKHSDKDSNDIPCCECNDGDKYPTKWEEAEG